MLQRFVQKRVLITGGASGLGKELVDRFAQLGWKIAIVDINLEGAQKVAESANQAGAEAFALYCDIGKDEDFKTIAEIIEDKWGGLDIIVNNAGVASAGMMVELSPEEWHRVINLNLHSVYRGCHYWLPLLAEKEPAHIVNTASFAGIAQAPAMMAYNVSKAAVIALSESLRAELGYRNIGVSVICPAFFKTNLLDSMPQSADTVIPLIRKWMDTSKVTAEDVAMDVIRGIEKNTLLIISHDYARKIYQTKRFFPKSYMKKLIKTVPSILAKRLKDDK